MDNMENDILDLDLSAIRKKRFRINGDNTRVLELNVSDLNIVTRLNEIYPKLRGLTDKLTKTDIPDSLTEEEAVDALAGILKDIDTEMRQLMDKLFDSNVSEICAPDGNMYDPVDGNFRFEHIILALAKLYENNFTMEFKKMQNRVSKHTGKYRKKK